MIESSKAALLDRIEQLARKNGELIAATNERSRLLDEAHAKRDKLDAERAEFDAKLKVAQETIGTLNFKIGVVEEQLSELKSVEQSKTLDEQRRKFVLSLFASSAGEVSTQTLTEYVDWLAGRETENQAAQIEAEFPKGRIDKL